MSLNLPGKARIGTNRVVLRKRLKQYCPDRELRDEALTALQAGHPASVWRKARALPKESI
jgi:hypothetical protein